MAQSPNPPRARPRCKLAATAGALAALWLLVAATALAQTGGWRVGTVDDQKISVRYRVSERSNEHGERVPLIEYVTTATAHVRMQRCIALLSDIARHKDFMGDKVSEKVAAHADTVIYSYYAAPWPFADNDRVTRMARTDDTASKTTVFTFVSTPTLVAASKVKRVTHYKAVYTFKDLGEGKVKLTTAVTMSPPSAVPLWMIRAAFPGVGAGILRKILELAGSAR